MSLQKLSSNYLFGKLENRSQGVAPFNKSCTPGSSCHAWVKFTVSDKSLALRCVKRCGVAELCHVAEQVTFRAVHQVMGSGQLLEYNLN